MKHFEGKAPNALRRLDVSARLLYTAFLLFTLAGLLSAGLLHVDGMGTSGDEAALYWRGDDTGMVYPKSFRQIVELTHFHLFTEPVALLVVAHLYNLGGDARARKLVAIVGTVVAMAIQIALPWGVAYGPAVLAALMLPASVLLVAGFFYMSVVATWNMWGPASGAGNGNGAA